MASHPSYAKVFIAGLLVSFIGTLPLGSLNIAAMQISLSKGWQPATYFSVGALIVEMIYVRLSLVALHWIRKNDRFFQSLQWLTLLIIISLAAGSFYAAMQPIAVKGNPLLNNSLPPFVLGLLMSAINPVQIPFWFGWSTILMQRGILTNQKQQYMLYVLGIGLGTFLGFLVFIWGGQLAADQLRHQQSLIQWVIGFVFLFTALLQGIKIWRKQSFLPASTESHNNTH